LSFPPTPYPPIDIFDPAVESTPIEKMSQLGQELIELVTRHTPDILCEAMVTKDTIWLKLINSSGGQASYKKSIFSLGIMGSLIRGTDMLFVGEIQSSCNPLTHPREVAKVVIQQLELAKNQASVPTRKLPVIFTPRGVANALVPSLMMAFNGKTVLEGASPIGNRLEDSVNRFSTQSYGSGTTRLLPIVPTAAPAMMKGYPASAPPLLSRGR